MTKRKPFPIGKCSDGMSDAEFVALISAQMMPRAREIRDFLDEVDKWGMKPSIETMLGIADEMFSGLALLWAGQSEAGQERMIEQLLPAWEQSRALELQIMERAKRMVAKHKEQADG